MKGKKGKICARGLHTRGIHFMKPETQILIDYLRLTSRKTREPVAGYLRVVIHLSASFDPLPSRFAKLGL